jgi:hypothetical protein
MIVARLDADMLGGECHAHLVRQPGVMLDEGDMH